MTTGHNRFGYSFRKQLRLLQMWSGCFLFFFSCLSWVDSGEPLRGGSFCISLQFLSHLLRGAWSCCVSILPQSRGIVPSSLWSSVVNRINLGVYVSMNIYIGIFFVYLFLLYYSSFVFSPFHCTCWRVYVVCRTWRMQYDGMAVCGFFTL